jgi:hypothetical protein
MCFGSLGSFVGSEKHQQLAKLVNFASFANLRARTDVLF